MTKEALKNRTKQFALDVFKFLMNLEKTKANDVVSFQLFESSSSVAANTELFAEENQLLIF